MTILEQEQQIPSVKQWRKLVSEYQKPDVLRSVWQIINSFGGYFLLWTAMYLSLRFVGYWLALLLAVPAAGFLLRIFIIQHDCGHGSFFAKRRWNDSVGTVCGVFTLVAYKYWRKSHALHHAHTNDLGDRGHGDVWTMTVDEYLAAPFWTRAAYRVFRNPIFLFGLAPGIHFIILHRLPLAGHSPEYQPGDRRSVWWNNLAILVLYGSLGWLVGFKTLFLIQLPISLIAATVGTWLFYVQHQYEDSYWEYKPEWDYTLAAMHGSSYYRLPKVLQWFTGNIGFHHIHHLSPRIPNYNLERCHQDNPELQRVVELNFWNSLRTVRLTLWDEEQKKLIGFGDLKRLRSNSVGL